MRPWKQISCNSIRLREEAKSNKRKRGVRITFCKKCERVAEERNAAAAATKQRSPRERTWATSAHTHATEGAPSTAAEHPPLDHALLMEAEPGGARTSQEENQEEPGGGVRSQEDIGRPRRTKRAWETSPLAVSSFPCPPDLHPGSGQGRLLDYPVLRLARASLLIVRNQKLSTSTAGELQGSPGSLLGSILGALGPLGLHFGRSWGSLGRLMGTLTLGVSLGRTGGPRSIFYDFSLSCWYDF